MPIDISQHDQDKFRAAASDGLAMQAGLGEVSNPAPGAEDFRGATLHYLARLCLKRSGCDTRRIMSPKQLAQELIRRHNALSVDDFDSLMLDASNKILKLAYREAQRTFLPITRIVPASDFKTIYGVALSEAPDLDPLSEHEEYKEAKFIDSQESYAVKKYGKRADLSFEMIVNDDLRSFLRVRQLFGAAAARKESDIVWALITSNPTMNEDSKALFHADHANLDGQNEPYTEERTEFTRDVVGFKVRHIFGAGIMDYRGLWKNPGD